MSTRAVLVLVLGLGALAACGQRRAPSGGALTVEWASSDSMIGRGRWRGNAEAGWCEPDHRLTVFAARGDTGAAVLMVLPALAVADSVPLVAASDTTSAMRATVAVRWPAPRELHALATGSGTLHLTRVTPGLAGRFEGTLTPRSTADGDEPPPSVTGSFEGVTLATGEAGCRLAGVGPSP